MPQRLQIPVPILAIILLVCFPGTRVRAESGGEEKAPAVPVEKPDVAGGSGNAPRAEEKKEKKESWFDLVKPCGDLRLIYDRIEKPGWDPEIPARDRLRIRVRLGLDAKICDDLDAKFRLATAEAKDVGKGGATISTNQTLTQSWSKKGVWLDVAALDCHPSAVPGFHLLGGKMETPFHSAGKSDLIWDPDLTIEGIALKYSPKFGDLEITAVAGGFVAMERADAADSLMFAMQAMLKYTLLEKKAHVLGGVGWFDYSATKGRDVFDPYGTNNSCGNTKAGTKYAFDYRLLSLFIEVAFEFDAGGWLIPVTAFGDLVGNTASGVDEGRGFLVGVSAGKDVKLSYCYREEEKDAVVGAFTDWDSWGGGTDSRGHRITLSIQVMKNFSLDVIYITGDLNMSGTNAANREGRYHRFIACLTAKF